MIVRAIKTLLAIIGLSIFCTIVFSVQSFAADKYTFSWDGNEGIIMTGSGDFFSAYAKQANPNKQTADNDQIGIQFQLSDSKHGDQSDDVAATYFTSGLNFDLLQDLVNRDRSWDRDPSQCTLNNLYIKVDRSVNPAKVIELDVRDTNKEDVTGVLNIGFDGDVANYCRGQLRNHLGSAKNTPIRGKSGQNTIIYNFEFGTDEKRKPTNKSNHDYEKAHFLHRTCGIKPARDWGSNVGQFAQQIGQLAKCKDSAGKAYDNIWGQCKYLSLQNIYEQSDSMGQQEDAGTEQVDAFSQCMKQYMGLGINDDVLHHLTVLDLVNTGNPESCSIPYIGWIICPMTRFIASLTDRAFDALKNLFIVAPLDDTSNPDSGGYALHRAWSVMRNIANVLFTILLIIIILAQTTNIGISNYGIKKLLPRLLVVALLVNASYVLCVLAVDISNILGSSLHGVFKFLEPTGGTALSTWSGVAEKVLVYIVPSTGVGLVLLVGGLVAFYPLILGAVTALIIAVTMIVARYAIILALIILAPVALACFLLPNTKSWYDKWQKMFVSMLMLYPIISIVFGAATVASLVVLNSGFARPNGEITLQIFGLAIQLLPFALVPLLLRFGGPALGQIGNGVRNSGLMKAARSWGDNQITRRRNARELAALQHHGGNRRRGIAGLRDRVIQRRYRRKALYARAEQEYNKSKLGYIADAAQNHPGFADRLARGGGDVDRVLADAIRVERHLSTEEVKTQKARLSEREHDVARLTNMASNAAESPEIRQAALELALEHASQAEFDELVKRSGGMNEHQRRTIGQASLSRGGYYGGSEVARNITNGSVNSSNFGAQVVAPGVSNLSDRGLGSMGASSLGEIHQAMNAGHIDAGTAAGIRASAQRVHGNAELQSSGESTAARDAALRNLM